MSKESKLIGQELANETRENVDWSLWDSLLLATAGGLNRMTFFQQVSGIGKQFTNMKAAGQIPQPQVMMVTEIMYRFYNVSGASFFGAGAGVGAATFYPTNIMIATGWWHFRIDDDTEYEGHLAQFSEVVQEWQAAAAGATSVTAYPDALTFYSLKINKPLILIPSRHFEIYCELTTPANGGGYTNQDTRMMWILKGVMNRAK